MTRPGSRVSSLADAVSLIRDGDVVAIGGCGNHGRPMALVREIVRQGRRNLHLVGVHGGIDVDLLVGAGCVTRIEMTSVGVGTLDAAPNLARAMDEGSVEWIRLPETVASERILAGSLKRPFLPSCLLPRESDPTHPCQREIVCPFTNEITMATQALVPDVALLHALASDMSGNVQLDTRRSAHAASDSTTARAARTVIVSVEQLISDEAAATRPFDTILSHHEVSCVVESPFGAHPCHFEPRYMADGDHVADFGERARSRDGFAAWIREFVEALPDHESYLNRAGSARLFALSRNRANRASG